MPEGLLGGGGIRGIAFQQDFAAEAMDEREVATIIALAGKEVGLASDPSLTVEGDAAAGDETMDMRVMGQRLSPCVQDGDEADFGAAAFGGERHERLGRGARLNRP